LKKNSQRRFVKIFLVDKIANIKKILPNINEILRVKINYETGVKPILPASSEWAVSSFRHRSSFRRATPCGCPTAGRPSGPRTFPTRSSPGFSGRTGSTILKQKILTKNFVLFYVKILKLVSFVYFIATRQTKLIC
jgi:hypothetical protein